MGAFYLPHIDPLCRNNYVGYSWYCSCLLKRNHYILVWCSKNWLNPPSCTYSFKLNIDVRQFVIINISVSEHVWQVTLLNRGLGTGGITGNYRLCLTDKTLSLIKRDCEMPQIELNLSNIRSCGNLRDFFFLEVGFQRSMFFDFVLVNFPNGLGRWWWLVCSD